jgi:hypothetical protein
MRDSPPHERRSDLRHPHVVAAPSTVHIAAISPAALAAKSSAERRVLHGADRGPSAGEISGLTTRQAAGLSAADLTDRVSDLSTSAVYAEVVQIAGLSTGQIGAMTMAQLNALSASAIVSFMGSQIGAPRCPTSPASRRRRLAPYRDADLRTDDGAWPGGRAEADLAAGVIGDRDHRRPLSRPRLPSLASQSRRRVS